MLIWDPTEFNEPVIFKSPEQEEKIWARFKQLNAIAGTEEAFEYLNTQLSDEYLSGPLRTALLQTIKMQWAVDGCHIPAPTKQIM